MKIEIFLEHEGQELPLVTIQNPEPGEFQFKSGTPSWVIFKGRCVISETAVSIDSDEFRNHPQARSNAASWPTTRKRGKK